MDMGCVFQLKVESREPAVPGARCWRVPLKTLRSFFGQLLSHFSFAQAFWVASLHGFSVGESGAHTREVCAPSQFSPFYEGGPSMHWLSTFSQEMQ